MEKALSITKLYQILSKKIGEYEAASLTDYITTKIESQVEDKTGQLAT